MTHDQKRILFNDFRKSLAAVGLSTVDADALICPLCWRDTLYDELSVEHIIPRSIGGRQKILTCRRCNNDHGSDLDAHLARYQRVVDAIQGHGRLRTKLNINGYEMIANLELGNGYKTFHVVDRATNPAASDAVRREFADDNVSYFNVTIFFNYIKNNFQTAVLRAAYLVLFQCFGYEYANHEIVQVIRHRIAVPTLEHPRLASLIIEAHNFMPPYDNEHYVVPCNVNGVEFFLVIIRIRRETTTYLGACLPIPVDGNDKFFELMEKTAQEHNGATLTIHTETMLQC